MFAQVDESGVFVAPTLENTGIPLPGNELRLYEPKWVESAWKEGMPIERINLLKQQSILSKSKQQASAQISALTVTVDTLVFDANEQSQLRMLAAIQASKKLGLTETTWRLTNDSTAVVTLTQLEQAQALAIQAIGDLVIGT